MASGTSKVTVELSAQDRSLLKEIRDALRAMGVHEPQVEEGAGAVRALVENKRPDVDQVFHWVSGG